MNQRARLFEELQRAITRGFTLAAVSVSLSCTKPPNEKAVDSGSTADVLNALNAVRPTPRLKSEDGGLLAQVPAGSLSCADDAQEPFYGRCCTNVHCYVPTSETCAEASEINKRFAGQMMPRLPLGSGTCSCGQPQGPFAQTDGGVTECCYVLGTRGCSGRPLREGEDAVVASVIARADWV